MRLLIDLQGAQTSGSRQRGIGRYSTALAQELAVLATAAGHDVHVLLNAAFPKALVEIRAELRGLLPPGSVHAWLPPVGSSEGVGDRFYTQAATMLREGVIAAIAPDAVLIASLFEGWGDEAVATVNGRIDAPVTAVILYDLIPYIQPGNYLTEEAGARFYHGRINQLRRADLWLAISESARREGLDYLGLPPDDVVAVSTAANAAFKPTPPSPEALERLHGRYGLRRKVVMYTGGVDGRKNIETLIRAYAMLPHATRHGCTLAIVCAATEWQQQTLMDAGRDCGLDDGDLRVTGFVPEADLVALYSSCALFVFPSLHEGFGLPALEAMACGAPVIGSDRSSIPEVIGDARALFDPTDDRAIAARMQQALDDPAFMAWLRSRAAGQAALFSWRRTAELALTSLVRKVEARGQVPHRQAPALLRGIHRPRLALVSPIPPQRSGIAQYAAELAPELARHYDVDFVTHSAAAGAPELAGIGAVLTPERFQQSGGNYDRIVYQLGNSDFHADMPELMAQFPGTVVLHDLFLSGLAWWKEIVGGSPGYWMSRLREGHGYTAALERLHARNDLQTDALQQRYTCNIDAVRFSTNVVVHSNYAQAALADAYGPGVAARTHVVPLLRRPRPPLDRAVVRKQLGYAPEDFIVCAFGGIAASKMHEVLLDAWFASALAANRTCRLAVVGGIDPTPYGQRILAAVAKGEGGERVRITGYVPDATYAEYLAAADAAVQLRREPRGETSAAAMDCLMAGVPLIINGGGTFDEIPAEFVTKLPGRFTSRELAEALEWVRDHPDERLARGAGAREHMRRTAAPKLIGDMYRDALEGPPRGTVAVRDTVLRLMRERIPAATLQAHAQGIASAVVRSLPLPAFRRRLLIDVTDVDRDAPEPETEAVDEMVRALLLDGGAPYSAEPFVVTGGTPALAQAYTYSLLDTVGADQPDEAIMIQPGDACLGFFIGQSNEPGHLEAWGQCRLWGVPTVVVCTDAMLALAERRGPGLAGLLDRVSRHADVVLVDDETSVARLAALLEETRAARLDPLRIVHTTRRQDPLPARLAAVLRRIRTAADDSGLVELLFASQHRQLVMMGDNPLVCVGCGELLGSGVRATGRPGILIFGPYLALTPGHYEIRVFMTVQDPADGYVEAVANLSIDVLDRVPLVAHRGDRGPALVLHITVGSRVRDFELRIAVTSDTRLVFKRYELVRVEQAPAPARVQGVAPAPPRPGRQAVLKGG